MFVPSFNILCTIINYLLFHNSYIFYKNKNNDVPPTTPGKMIGVKYKMVLFY